MLGFLFEEAEELGSVGRFYKRIDKFKIRNYQEKYLWSTYKDSVETFPERQKNWEAQQDKIASGEYKGRKLRKPSIAWKPGCPKFRILHPVIEHHLWWLLHNNIAHTLIGLVPIKLFFEFHDWTSKKLNAD